MSELGKSFMLYGSAILITEGGGGFSPVNVTAEVNLATWVAKGGSLDAKGRRLNEKGGGVRSKLFWLMVNTSQTVSTQYNYSSEPGAQNRESVG